MMIGRPWTDDQDEALKTLAWRGLVPATIARKLGRTPRAVLERAELLGVAIYERDTPWTGSEARPRQIISNGQMAERYGNLGISYGSAKPTCPTNGPAQPPSKGSGRT